MDGIQLLYEEHDNILLFTKVVDKLCCNVLQGEEVPVEKFRQCVEFVKQYADKHHHGKEEEILFHYMLEELNPLAEKLIRHGMLVEHDLGRYHASELEKSLDAYEAEPSVEKKLPILLHAAGHADLLKRHILKENTAAFAFGKRSLSQEIKEKIDEDTQQFEEKAKQKKVQEKYLSWLKDILQELKVEYTQEIIW